MEWTRCRVSKPGQRPASLGLCLCTAAMLCSSVVADINIELRPECEKRSVGQTVRVGIYVVSDSKSDQLMAAAQVIIGWNPAELTLIGVDAPGPGLQSSGFPDDPFGINEVIPPADGDGLYIALAELGNPLEATPEGTLLNTLEFVSLIPASPTTVSVLASAGSPPTNSVVFDGTVPNLDVTGLLIPAIIQINPIPYCPADLFPVGAPDRVVGPGDLGELLANWGPCDTFDPVCPTNEDCPADLFPVGNPDGVVGPGDLAELLANWGECPVCGNAGAGNCFEADGTPGCDDAECCEAVCAVDAFCCDVEWDGICAGEAADLCEGCGDPDAGDCCTANETPFCNNRTCCNAVCAIDAFCCEVAWDSICADEAADNANCKCDGDGVCDKSNPNDCCVAGAGPGCNQPACCESVCAADPFCCDNNTWDGLCADAALTDPNCECGDPACVLSDNDCCVANATPGCNNPACCEIICAADSFCCNVEWDSICAGAAAKEPLCNCTPAGCPKSDHNCFEQGIAGCTDAECCDMVCSIDDFCCETQWDGICVDLAVENCTGCGDPDSGDCCVADGTPFCNNRTCCDIICAADAFCCDISWDGLCAGAAQAEPACNCPVDVCGGGNPNDCCAANESPGCSDADCCEAVCAIDPFCCDEVWDAICADEAAAEPACGCGGDPACGSGAGDCCVADGTPGCEDVDCCNAICAADPFCCDTSWDSICAGDAAAEPLCGCGGNPACGPGAGDCCVADGTPGCEDVDCCNAICAADPFCCDTSWDSICAGDAAAEPLCGCGG